MQTEPYIQCEAAAVCDAKRHTAVNIAQLGARGTLSGTCELPGDKLFW